MDTLFDTPKRKATAHSRADQIKARFVAFHKANPQVWLLFQRFTFDMIDTGRVHYSARAIGHQIRWHTALKTTDELKLNDHYTVYYGRMFEAVHRECKGFFRHRKRISAEKPAADNDQAVFDSGPPDGEEQLYRELAELGST